MAKPALRPLLCTLLLLAGASVSLAQPTPAPVTPPAPADRKTPTPYHIVIISVDGLRPDLLLRANTPALHKLLDESAYSMWAKTTAVSITLPSHVSMLTGVVPQAHGIMWNDDIPLAEPVYPKWPTLFELGKRAGYTTALVAGKSKFSALNRPGTIDFVSIGHPKGAQEDVAEDTRVGDTVIDMLRTGKPDILFAHFPGADRVGHAEGWGTPNQIKVIEHIDGHIGRILATLDELNLRDSTYVLISADHGGQGKSHGADDTRSRTIPWILRGPNVRAGYDLASASTLDIKTEDTFATTAYLLKIPVTKAVSGLPVKIAIKNSGEMIEDKKPE